MSLAEIIAAQQDKLSDADRRLVDVLLADKAAGSFLPAHLVASKAGVHASTAGRLARKLGFSSYRDMRGALQDTILADLDASVRVRRRLKRAEGHSLLGSVIEGEISALAALPSQVSDADIVHAARLLRDANTILAFGEGHASSLAEIFVRRLVRSGYGARHVGHADWQAADALLSLTAQDIVVVFVFRHASPGASRVVSYARTIGATTLLVTDRHAGMPVCDTQLVAARGNEGEFHSLSVPMAICNTLILELSRTDHGRSLAKLAKVDTLQRMFRERPD
ncbi:MAG: MurR/RpiR family transcriptional regulator [Chelatococcus sp.]|uniref:MurR/RpiR family transcriptional regulator n=1 Tax=Chelatococcus sp. TaxID=1953771 RepID=UPI0025BC1338|nr:MurR/RpiR family transcriptional regulator [Chelatococcus sp.]MBX3536944.1 MurR/RpiR family transcriptional regulator [Chelatococcus sp.]